jgi:hypothetical protein
MQLMQAAPDYASDGHVAWDYVDIRKIADLGELGEHP